MGLKFETPTLAYEAVEAWSARAIEYEEAVFQSGEGLGYDEIPGEPDNWAHWLIQHGWPEGCVPILVHDDGRMLADLGCGHFDVYDNTGIDQVAWIPDAFLTKVHPIAEMLLEAGYKKEDIKTYFKNSIANFLDV